MDVVFHNKNQTPTRWGFSENKLWFRKLVKKFPPKFMQFFFSDLHYIYIQKNPIFFVAMEQKFTLIGKKKTLNITTKHRVYKISSVG